MIGYYIHHVGLGHLHRALAAAAHLGEPVTALSSRPVDPRWPGPWVQLRRDDEAGIPRMPDAHGFLHWAPLHDPGLQHRMHQLAEWIRIHRPAVLVADLSAEVTTLARLMGVPVVTVTLPGLRDDPAHQRGFELAEAIIAPWPPEFGQLGPSITRFGSAVHYVGAVSRYECQPPAPPGHRAAPAGPGPAASTGVSGSRRVLSLSGTGGSTGGSAGAGGPAAAPVVPGWHWTDAGPGNWHPDPWALITSSDVVVTHAGLGSLADVALAGRPAVVIPQARPHGEQVTTAAALAAAGLATVLDEMPSSAAQWQAALEDALTRDGREWRRWADGGGGRRMAQVITEVAVAAA